MHKSLYIIIIIYISKIVDILYKKKFYLYFLFIISLIKKLRYNKTNKFILNIYKYTKIFTILNY